MTALAIFVIVPFAVAAYIGLRRKTFGFSEVAAILLICAGAALMGVAAYIAPPGDQTVASLHGGLFIAGLGLMLLALKLCYRGAWVYGLGTALSIIAFFLPRNYQGWYFVAMMAGITFGLFGYSALQAIRRARRPPAG